MLALSKKFEEIDLFSAKVDLKLKKQSEHKTLCGAFLSLCLLLIMLNFGWMSFSEMLERTNPSVISSE